MGAHTATACSGSPSGWPAWAARSRPGTLATVTSGSRPRCPPLRSRRHDPPAARRRREPHPLRPGLAAVPSGGPEVVAQAASGDEALAAARRYRPDVAVLDLQMPGLDGIAVAE